jgi:hypothetical protein
MICLVFIYFEIFVDDDNEMVDEDMESSDPSEDGKKSYPL